MAKAPAWRPFHAVFMERVIKVAEVQRHRSNADDEGARQFFDSGRRPGLYGDYRWRVDVPPTASPRWEGRRPAPPPLAANVQAGWDAAMPYYRSFTADLFNGVLIAEASHWMSGVRREFAPAEWEQPRLVVDVFRGDLFVRPAASATWKAITLHTTEDQPVRPDKKGRGGRPPDYLWHEWKQALDAWLRGHRRPEEIERLVEWSKDWFKDNDAGVPSDRSIRRHLKPYYPRD